MAICENIVFINVLNIYIHTNEKLWWELRIKSCNYLGLSVAEDRWKWPLIPCNTKLNIHLIMPGTKTPTATLAFTAFHLMHVVCSFFKVPLRWPNVPPHPPHNMLWESSIMSMLPGNRSPDIHEMRGRFAAMINLIQHGGHSWITESF